MAPERMAGILSAPNHLCYFVSFFALFVTYFIMYFVHNVAATVSYDQK
jgi:cytochrome oxidase assembly protein ShyY1